MLGINPHPGFLLSLPIGDGGIAMWQASEQARALKLGFFLDENDGALQADDEQDTFATPDEVSEYLCDLASRKGPNQKLAIRAMVFANHANMMAWVARLREDDDA